MTDEEFIALMEMPKRFEEDRIVLPASGEKSRPLNVSSITTIDTFLLDVDRRGTYTLTKVKMQERYQVNTALVRLEIDCRPHMNPDGTVTSRDHIHIYREGYGLRWAYDLKDFDRALFKDTGNFMTLFDDFCKYCMISYDDVEIQGVL